VLPTAAAQDQYPHAAHYRSRTGPAPAKTSPCGFGTHGVDKLDNPRSGHNCAFVDLARHTMPGAPDAAPDLAGVRPVRVECGAHSAT
jgi:hypothetical protein